MKIILVLSFIMSFCFSTSIDIKNLQNEFKEKVIQINAYRKRYNSFLIKNCEDDFSCYEKYIDRLKNWESVQNDKYLEKYLLNKKSLLTFDIEYWDRLEKKLIEKKEENQLQFTHSQFVSSIDLENQLFILTLWDIETQKFYYIGKDYISSGNIYRESEISLGDDHYLKTPAGIFKSKIGWRSEGKIGEDKKTLGYGYKDRFVFYFGKQKSVRFNIFDQNGKKIEDIDRWKLIVDELDFALHSHKSSKKFGEPYSHGCVRMSDELNRFLDNNLVLHKNMFSDDGWMSNYTKEPKEIKNRTLAGEYLIIFDKL